MEGSDNAGLSERSRKGLMNRGRFKWDAEKGCLVPVEKPARVESHAVHTDEMEPMQSMADCKFYTSKSAYRRSLKEQGFIEVGNDVDGFKPKNVFETPEYMEQLREDMTRSYYEVRDGMAPLSELDRERCKRINHYNEHYNYDRRDRDRDGSE